MKLISHRGNINGKNIPLENTSEYIESALKLGYDVEIDVWLLDNDPQLYLGHDGPEHKIELKWLLERKNKLWIHCKNFNSLTMLLKYKNELQLFYHEKENYTILSNGFIWAHDINNVDSKCIIPLLSKKDVESWTPTEVYGVCSDYIDLIK